MTMAPASVRATTQGVPVAANDGVPSPEVTIPIYFLGLGIMGFGLIAAAGRTRTTSP